MASADMSLESDPLGSGQQPRARIRLMLKLQKKGAAQTPVINQSSTLSVNTGSTVSAPSITAVNGSTNRKESTAFRGLVNAGNSCYAAATLQVLFHFAEFRENVQRLAAATVEQGVIHSLAGLFSSLEQQQHAHATSVSVTEFFRCLQYVLLDSN